MCCVADWYHRNEGERENCASKRRERGRVINGSDESLPPKLKFVLRTLKVPSPSHGVQTTRCALISLNNLGHRQGARWRLPSVCQPPPQTSLPPPRLSLLTQCIERRARGYNEPIALQPGQHIQGHDRCFVAWTRIGIEVERRGFLGGLPTLTFAAPSDSGIAIAELLEEVVEEGAFFLRGLCSLRPVCFGLFLGLLPPFGC